MVWLWKASTRTSQNTCHLLLLPLSLSHQLTFELSLKLPFDFCCHSKPHQPLRSQALPPPPLLSPSIPIAAPLLPLRHGVLLDGRGGDRRLHGPLPRSLLHHPRPHVRRLPPRLQPLRLPRRRCRREDLAALGPSGDGGVCSARAGPGGGHHVGEAEGVRRIRPQEAPVDGDQGSSLRRLHGEVILWTWRALCLLCRKRNKSGLGSYVL